MAEKQQKNHIEDEQTNALTKPLSFFKKLSLKKLLLIDFAKEAAKGEKSYGRIGDKLVNTVKIFFVATRKFLDDRCLIRAASFTYMLIVSLIPTLTVALTVYSVFAGADDKKNELFTKISFFIAENNIRLNLEPLFNGISSLVENAGKVGGISAIVMIFSATAMLRTLEKSFNDIWKVQQQRRFVLRMVYYWSAMTLGPILVFMATVVTKQMTDMFSPSKLTAMYAQENRLWVSGSKGMLAYADDNSAGLKPIADNMINFDNQRIYSYDGSTQTFTLIDNGDIDKSELKKTMFTGIAFAGEIGRAVADNGIILETENSGKQWHIKKLGNRSLNAIYLADASTGFIAANNGMLLVTRDGGKQWQQVDLNGVTVNLNSISFNGRRGIITGDSGTIFLTNNGGITWAQEKIAEAKGAAINNAIFAEDGTIWLMGKSGLLLKSDAGGKWQTANYKSFDYNTGMFKNGNVGIAAGSRGRIIYTEDGGESWTQRRLPAANVNAMLNVGGTIWAAGDQGMFMFSKDNGVLWEGQKGRSVIAFLIKFSAPFIFIWFTFFLCYTMLPNTKIQIKGAAISAAFTSAVWVLFILLFMVYIRSFANGTFAIYGALASIPLFLLMVYASAIIIFYGAEVAYTLMHPEIYQKITKESGTDKQTIHVYYGIAILNRIFQRFEEGGGGTKYEELTEVCANNSEEVDFFVKKFVADGLILQSLRMGFMPANASKNIMLSDIVNSIYSMSLTVPAEAGESHLKKYLSGLFKQMEDNRKNFIGGISLKDIIDGSDAKPQLN